jgi:polysaccharide export outer membrane protein
MRYVAILLAGLLSACSLSHYPQAQPRLTGEEAIYHLNAGDTVNIRIYDEPDMSGKFIVDSEGKLAIPLAEKVSVAGLTEQHAAQTIASTLQKDGYLRHPKISLDIDQARPFFVMGEVEHAGSYPFASNLTVYQAVAMAGGYSYRADRHDITIRRQTGQEAGAEQRLSATEDTPLLPGDVIEIGERFF